MFKQFFGVYAFTMIVLSLYVVNHMVYIFGAKYISIKRIIIEFVIELIYCILIISNNNYIWLLYVNVLLKIIIILECIYYVCCTYFYDANRTPQTHVISNKVFQVLGVIIIMMGIIHSYLNSFNYYLYMQALQCIATVVVLLIVILLSSLIYV